MGTATATFTSWTTSRASPSFPSTRTTSLAGTAPRTPSPSRIGPTSSPPSFPSCISRCDRRPSAAARRDWPDCSAPAPRRFLPSTPQPPPNPPPGRTRGSRVRIGSTISRTRTANSRPGICSDRSSRTSIARPSREDPRSASSSSGTGGTSVPVPSRSWRGSCDGGASRRIRPARRRRRRRRTLWVCVGSRTTGGGPSGRSSDRATR
mmetsp:Transcript_29657/g.87963  ORF Transcript_29657/g.87963 Transcript_29657/m.87963 type:complete len:207 (-) Transcript_29657:467-1087(-)